MERFVTTGWHWDDSYAWHNAGGAGPLGYDGIWVQPGVADFETASTKTRFKDPRSRCRTSRSDNVLLRGRDATEEELLGFTPPITFVQRRSSATPVAEKPAREHPSDAARTRLPFARWGAH